MDSDRFWSGGDREALSPPEYISDGAGDHGQCYQAVSAV